MVWVVAVHEWFFLYYFCCQLFPCCQKEMTSVIKVNSYLQSPLGFSYNEYHTLVVSRSCTHTPLTTFGIFIPVTFGILLGCLVGSTTGVDVNWADAYDDHGVGGLILEMLYPRGFAKFLLVLLSLGEGRNT